MSADSHPQIQGLGKAERIVTHRSKMGELESGSVRVHTVWNDPNFSETRSMGANTLEGVLVYIVEWARISAE